MKVSGESRALATGAPGLGEHTGEILGEAGYSAGEIQALRADGVL